MNTTITISVWTIIFVALNWFICGYYLGKYKWKPTRSNSSTFTVGSDVKSIVIQGYGGSSGGSFGKPGDSYDIRFDKTKEGGGPIFENEIIKSNGRGPSAIELKHLEKSSGTSGGALGKGGIK